MSFGLDFPIIETKLAWNGQDAFSSNPCTTRVKQSYKESMKDGMNK